MKRIRTVCAVAFLFALLGSANATTITFDFTGTVTQVSLDDVFGDIAAGDSIQGSYNFDSAAADLAPSDPATGIFSYGTPFGMKVTVGAHEFVTAGLLNIGILNSFVDQYTVFALSSSGDLTLELLLQDNTGAAFPTDGLPLAAPDLAHFALKDFHLRAMFDGVEIQVDGQLTTLAGDVVPVPEPSFAVLLLAGSTLLLLARLRLRSKLN